MSATIFGCFGLLAAVFVAGVAFVYGIRWLWRRAGRLRVVPRCIVRGALIAVPFTPSFYGHMGIVPAVFVLAMPEEEWRWQYGLLPLVVSWLVVTVALLAAENSLARQQRSGHGDVPRA